MNKYKWLIFRCSTNPARLIKLLLSRNFKEESEKGFRVVSKTENSISAIFFEKLVSMEKLENPFGTSRNVEVVRYSSLNFKFYFQYINKETYVLEIKDPPRSIRPLILELSDMLDGITVSEFKLSVLDLYLKIKNSSPRAKIVKIKASGIPISDYSTMKAEVSSSADAMKDFEAYFHNIPKAIEKIKIERPSTNGFGFVEIASNGLCSCDDDSFDLIRELMLNEGSNQ